MGTNPKNSLGLYGFLSTFFIASIYFCFLTIIAHCPAFLSNAHASEGGSSNYTPGTYGDFAMNVLPTGLSIRNNMIYYDGKLKSYPVNYEGVLGVEPDFKVDFRLDILQAVYAANFKILGGRYFANVNIPYVFDAQLKVDLGALFEGSDNDVGLGDIQFVPFGLLWDINNFHILVAENIVAPTGEYEADDLLSIGRNYWGFETIVGVTWLQPKRGHEVSVTLGYMTNTENTDTNYKTGDEFHVDYTLAQYFSESFGVGVVGYYYSQTTNDSGSGYDDLNSLFPGPLSTRDDLKGLRGDGGAIGPAIMWGPKIGGRALNIIFKWMNEYNNTNRFDGSWYNLSVAMSF